MRLKVLTYTHYNNKQINPKSNHMRTKLLMLFAVLGLMLSQSIYAQPKTVTVPVTVLG